MARIENTELSYLDLLDMLHADVESDEGLPDDVYNQAMDLLVELHSLLSDYSG